MEKKISSPNRKTQKSVGLETFVPPVDALASRPDKLSTSLHAQKGPDLPSSDLNL